jgi:hypothetical protein
LISLSKLSTKSFIPIVLLIMIISSNYLSTPKVYAKGVYDFTDFSYASQAVWKTGAGVITFPGSSGDPKGFVTLVEEASLEGETNFPKALETHPQYVSNGYIMGTYPTRTVLSKERLIVRIGFLTSGFSLDGADFLVKFIDSSESVYTILNVHADFDDRLDRYVVDLSAYAGKVGNFVLIVEGGKSTDGDSAAWVEAYIDQVTLADLKVDDFWLSEGFVHYRISNIGAEPLGSLEYSSDFVNSLEINGIQASLDFIGVYLGPGQSVEKKFDMRWQVESSIISVKITLDINRDISEVNKENNSLEKSWHLLPDYEPEDVTWTPSLPSMGQFIDLTVTIGNHGNVTSSVCEGILTVNGVSERIFTVPKIIPWGSANVTVKWGPILLGDNNISFNIDSNNTVIESVETNNEIDAIVSGSSEPPPPEKKPDLKADGIVLFPLAPKTYKLITFTPLISNGGNVNSPASKAKLFANDTLIGTIMIPPIPASLSLSNVADVKITWIPSKAGMYFIEVIVDEENVVNELNETNNQKLSRIIVKVNDEPLPAVGIMVSPSKPTELDTIEFKITSLASVSISRISLYVNESEVGRVDNESYLIQSIGPFDSGTSFSYWVRSIDILGNVYTSPLYNLNIVSYIPIDGRVTVEISPLNPSAVDDISFKVVSSIPATDRIRLYVNDILYGEALGRSNNTFALAKLHAGTFFTYFAEATSLTGEGSRTQKHEISVNKAQIQISISLKNVDILEGEMIQLNGLISPGGTSLPINLIYNKSGEVYQKIVVSNEAGAFLDEFEPEELGGWEITAVFHSNNDYLSAKSSPVVLNVHSTYSLKNPQVLIGLFLILGSISIAGVFFWRKRANKKSS